MVIISAEESVREFARTNRFANVKVVSVDFEPLEMRAAIVDATDPVQNSEALDAFPLTIGASPEMIYIKGTRPMRRKIQRLTAPDELMTHWRRSGRASLKEMRGEFMARVERMLMEGVLEKTQGHRKKAAAFLNINFKFFLNKMKAYNFT